MTSVVRGCVIAGGALALAWFGLLAMDTRILLSETMIEPKSGGQASLECRYFNGRSVVEKEFWYAPNNMFGRDSCPFLTGP